jgi:hypothetical protein
MAVLLYHPPTRLMAREARPGLLEPFRRGEISIGECRRAVADGPALAQGGPGGGTVTRLILRLGRVYGVPRCP